MDIDEKKMKSIIKINYVNHNKTTTTTTKCSTFFVDRFKCVGDGRGHLVIQKKKNKQKTGPVHLCFFIEPEYMEIDL